MSGTELHAHIAKAWARCGAFISESLRVSAEAGFYPDPLHLGPAFAVLYSSEGQGEPDLDASEVRRGESS